MNLIGSDYCQLQAVVWQKKGLIWYNGKTSFMSEGSFDSNDQLQEPSGADAYGLENLREKIMHKIEDLQDAATMHKVWSLLSEKPAEPTPLQLARHTEAIFNQYNETLSKLAK